MPDENTPQEPEVLESDKLAEAELEKFSDPKPAEPPADEAKPESAEPKAEEPPPDAPAPEKPQGPIMVPKHRMDAATARARRVEGENEGLRTKIAELEAAQAQAPAQALAASAVPAAPAEPDTPQPSLAVKQAQFELQQLNTQLAEATAELKKDEITRLNQEVQTKMLELNQAQMADMLASQPKPEAPQQVDPHAVANQAAAQIAYKETVANIEEMYPALNMDLTETFNEAAARDVVRVRDAYIADGYSDVEALTEAVEMVALKHKLAPAGQQTEQPPAAPARDVQRNLDAANQQPPDIHAVGSDSHQAGAQESTPDIMKLTQDEFDALPESTKAKMRGDYA